MDICNIESQPTCCVEALMRTAAASPNAVRLGPALTPSPASLTNPLTAGKAIASTKAFALTRADS